MRTVMMEKLMLSVVLASQMSSRDPMCLVHAKWCKSSLGASKPSSSGAITPRSQSLWVTTRVSSVVRTQSMMMIMMMCSSNGVSMISKIGLCRCQRSSKHEPSSGTTGTAWCWWRARNWSRSRDRNPSFSQDDAVFIFGRRGWWCSRCCHGR